MNFIRRVACFCTHGTKQPPTALVHLSVVSSSRVDTRKFTRQLAPPRGSNSRRFHLKRFAAARPDETACLSSAKPITRATATTALFFRGCLESASSEILRATPRYQTSCKIQPPRWENYLKKFFFVRCQGARKYSRGCNPYGVKVSLANFASSRSLRQNDQYLENLKFLSTIYLFIIESLFNP